MEPPASNSIKDATEPPALTNEEAEYLRLLDEAYLYRVDVFVPNIEVYYTTNYSDKIEIETMKSVEVWNNEGRKQTYPQFNSSLIDWQKIQAVPIGSTSMIDFGYHPPDYVLSSVFLSYMGEIEYNPDYLDIAPIRTAHRTTFIADAHSTAPGSIQTKDNFYRVAVKDERVDYERSYGEDLSPLPGERFLQIYSLTAIWGRDVYEYSILIEPE